MSMTISRIHDDRGAQANAGLGPDGRVLPEADAEPLRCRGCGASPRWVDPARTETLRRYAVPHSARPDVHAVWRDTTVTRCDSCADRRELAAELLAEHPRVARGLGPVGLDQLDAALAALDAIGLRPRKVVGSLVVSDEEVRELLAVLRDPGAAVLWSESLTSKGGGRWAHVEREDRAAAKAACRQLVHLNVETPAPCAPPSRDGALTACLLCGVGALRVKRHEAESVWGALRRVQPGTLGGALRPEPVAGFLCPECRVAVEHEGAPGMGAVRRALLWSLGRVKESGGRWHVKLGSNIRAWAAVPGAEPNSTPWGHLDLASLRVSLADLERRGVVRPLRPGESR